MLLRTLSLLLVLALPTGALIHALAPTPAHAAPVPAVPASELGPRHQAASQLTYRLLSNPRYAYAPRVASPEVADKTLENFLGQLDPQRMFLTQDDLAQVDATRERINAALQGKDLSVAMDIHKAWSTRAAERIAYAKSLLDEPFDFSVDEDWVVRDETSPRARDLEQSNELWRQFVKNDALRLRLAGKSDQDIATTLAKRYDRLALALSNDSADQVVAAFLNAYAGVLDPHTNYMAPVDAESFNMSMSLALEGIGAVLQIHDDTPAVRSLIPGGPASKSGKVGVGDRILAVGQGKDGPMVDVVGWRLDEVVGLIRGQRGTTVRLSLSGPDGAAERTIALARDRVEMEDQQASSQVIDSHGMKVGVVKLPGFYLDMAGAAAGDANARSATQDVARLVGQLKDQGIDALLVDLRGNGGGSLTEAVSLTGLFIDTGPVVQIQMADNSIEVQGDAKPGAAWAGPLAVLVDGQSASASEIFAAAIQDHGRGLVIGENTFGKGTVQTMVNLDAVANAPGANFGQVKLTIAQFFRISGSTTQRDGVHPDLAFAQTLDGDQPGEARLPHALEPTTIEPAAYQTNPAVAALLPALRAAHAARAQADPSLRWWLQDVAEYRARRDSRRVSLNLAQRQAERQRLEDQRIRRDAQRRELGLFVSTARPDDGLFEDERSIAEQVAQEEQDKAQAKHDPILAEAARVLAHAVEINPTALALSPATPAAPVPPTAASARSTPNG